MTCMAFQSILPTGSRALGDAKGPGGSGVFDFFFEAIDLPNLAEGPALIVLAAKKVTLEKNFITINSPDAVCQQSYEEAAGQSHFIWRLLPNPSDTWVLQMHQISSGRLKPAGNRIGVHARNAQGLPARVRDQFAVARLFLIYPSGC